MLKIGFVAPMLGKNPGYVLSQAEIQAKLFAQAGYEVLCTSTIPSPYVRIADMVKSIISWQGKVDLLIHSVFSGRGFINTDVVSRLARVLDIPVVFVLRGGALPTFAGKHEKWVKRTFARAEVIVSPSNFLAHYFSGLGYPVVVIPNVIELTDYPFTLRSIIQPNLIWMRSFHALYHPEMAIEVLQKVLLHYPQARLTMAGDDKGMLTAVKTQTKQLNLEDNVHFAGFLDIASKQQQFAKHDIYLHTNRVDNMPVSVVEAAAFGLPIVATKVGGIPYLLQEGQTGLLVESGDVAGMATAVCRLLEEPQLVTKLSSNGRELAEKSKWDNVKIQWESLFKQLFEDSR